MKNYLLLGLGGMGSFHLKSFNLIKEKCKIYVYDKFCPIKKLTKKIKLIDLNTNIELFILFNPPINKKIYLIIDSTYSDQRLKNILSIIKKNKVNFILLEKFIFSKKNHFDKFEKIVSPKLINKTYVNTWSLLIFKLLKFNKIKSRKIDFSVIEAHGNMATNLIHYIYLFNLVTKQNDTSLNLSFVSKKILKSKRKNYHELSGEILAFNKKGSFRIVTKKNINFAQIKIKGNNLSYLIVIFKNGKIEFSDLLKKNKCTYIFPFSSITTGKFTKSLIKNKKSNLLPKYKNIETVSREILKKIDNKFKSKVVIT